jgi:phage terminase large subunit
MGLDWFYMSTEFSIKGMNGTEFLFKGLRRNINEIKSTEGIDCCWIEEGQSVSEHSWTVLTPTIRKPGSEIWVVFNPDSPDDATYRRFVTHKPDNCTLITANYSDNPFFPEVLETERLYDLKNNPDIYDWKWLGKPRIITDAQIFHGKFELLDFETPANVDRLFFGADWGFATDPTVLVRSFIESNCLYIDYEAYGLHTEITDLPALFDQIPGSRKWPIKADSARPETISYMRNKGFQITGAKKWPGSVEEGVEFMRGFDRIYIHPRCPHTYEEFRLYSYKVDQRSGDILPIIVDKYNHGIDALRYALEPLMRNKGLVFA